MKLPRQIENLENENQLDALEPFGPDVRRILRRFKEKREPAPIAKRPGSHLSSLTEMITKSGNGKYKKRTAPYHVAEFFGSDVMDVHQILGRRKLENLSGRSRLLFEKTMLSRKTINLMVTAQQRGLMWMEFWSRVCLPGQGSLDYMCATAKKDSNGDVLRRGLSLWCVKINDLIIKTFLKKEN